MWMDHGGLWQLPSHSAAASNRNFIQFGAREEVVSQVLPLVPLLSLGIYPAQFFVKKEEFLFDV